MNNDSEDPRLSYKTFQKQAIHVSKVADLSNNMLNKCVFTEHSTMSLPHVQTVHPISDSPYDNETVINI